MYMWAFGFMHRVVTESAHWTLFTDAIFYPRGIDLTLPLIFGVGLPLFLSIPFVHFLGIILTYNIFILGSFILNAYVTFILVRHFTQDSAAGLIAGVIFAFFPYHMVRSLAHLNLLTSGFCIPLYILFFIQTMRNGGVTSTILVALSFAFTVISNLYYAFFLGLFVIIYVFYNLKYENVDIIKSQLFKRLLSISSITLLLLLPIAWKIFVHSWDDFHVNIPRVISYQFGADLLAFFLPSSFHSFWGNFVKPIYYYHLTGGISEQTVYLGYIVIVLALIAVVKGATHETRFWALSAVIFFVLALGAFLRIYGMPTGIPLPYWLLLSLPLVNTFRGASRAGIMVMMALSILAGYGTTYLLKRFDGRKGVRFLILAAILTAITVEFVAVPLPLADARVPKLYQKIAAQSRTGGTLIDLPLHKLLTKYEYYQTTHGKRLLLGQASRISDELATNYADSLPFVKLFKNPEFIHVYEQSQIDKGAALQLIEFFDLSYIVIHKDLLGSDMFDILGYSPRSSTRLQASEMVQRLTRFFLTHFPVVHVEADGDLVILELARKNQNASETGTDGEFLIDFESETSPEFLAEGWWPTEYDGKVTFAWSSGKASQLWVRLVRPQDYTMELRLSRIVSPDHPDQAVTIYVNKHLVSEIPLQVDGWQLYTVSIPNTALTSGINNLRFMYRTTTSPAKIYPDSMDQRNLAVAFDFIRLRAKGERS